MKNLKTFLTFTSIIAALATNSFAASDKYIIEPNHTSVTWNANHFGFSNPSGKFSEVSGHIIFDENKPEKSSVDVIINLASLLTGLPKFDEHLKSKDFLDVATFPKAKFVSNKIVVTDKNKAKITGNLTLLKISKPVTLDVTFNKSGISPATKKQTIGFSATTQIKRSDFGINYAIPNIADEVNLVIEAEANH